MTITLGTTTLCAGSERRQDGTPMGPQNITVSETPGAAIREYVGADRVEGEHVGCDHGVMTFQVTRVYPNEDAATSYAITGHRDEDTSGILAVDGITVYANAVMTSKQISQCGVAVIVSYTIEG